MHESKLLECLFIKKHQFLIFNPVERAYHDKQVLVQGLDALGLATLDSVSSAAFARLPLSVPYSSSLMADEDIANLRTLSRLLLLLSRLQKNENPNSVSFSVLSYFVTIWQDHAEVGDLRWASLVPPFHLTTITEKLGIRRITWHCFAYLTVLLSVEYLDN